MLAACDDHGLRGRVVVDKGVLLFTTMAVGHLRALGSSQSYGQRGRRGEPGGCCPGLVLERAAVSQRRVGRHGWRADGRTIERDGALFGLLMLAFKGIEECPW